MVHFASRLSLQKNFSYFQGLQSEIRLTYNMTKQNCDEALASQAAAGDATAFRRLLDRHYDRVFRVVFSVVRHQNDAEDITQEIWAAMPKKLRSWRGDAKLTSWLHRIAVNAAKDALRRSATQARTTAGYAEIRSLREEDTKDTQERLSWLNAALDTLSDDLRETAALPLGEDMNFAQAADVLGIAEGTVAWRMSEIRKRLKTLASRDGNKGKEAWA